MQKKPLKNRVSVLWGVVALGYLNRIDIYVKSFKWIFEIGLQFSGFFVWLVVNDEINNENVYLSTEQISARLIKPITRVVSMAGSTSILVLENINIFYYKQMK